MKRVANLADREEVLKLLKSLYEDDNEEEGANPPRVAGTELFGRMAEVSPDIEAFLSQDEQ